jgi:hypothetical protein
LALDGGAQMIVRDDPKTGRGGHWSQTRHCLLDHSLFAIKREQLLGSAFAAQGPEARASAAS